MAWEDPLIKASLDGLLEAFRSLKRKGQVRRKKALLSTVVTELLRIEPDLPWAEAVLDAVEASGGTPTRELLRAREILKAAKRQRKGGAGRKTKRRARRSSRRATPRRRGRS